MDILHIERMLILLIEFHKYQDVNIARLKHLYRCSIVDEALKKNLNVPENEYILLAEQNFYADIRDLFNNLGTLFVWEENDVYLSALRIEQYCDGLLVTWLETDPDFRRKGNGRRLLISTIRELKNNSALKIYAHIHKGNHASIALHLSCGFEKISNSAKLLDGSVLPNMQTYCC